MAAAAKFLVAASKKIIFVVPNFVAVTTPFFSVKVGNKKTFIGADQRSVKDVVVRTLRKFHKDGSFRGKV